MDASSEHSKSPFAELRRRLALLFSSAQVRDVPTEDIGFAARSRSVSLDTHPRGPEWGSAPGLIDPAECSVRVSDPSTHSSLLDIGVTLAGGPDDPGVSVSPPAIHSAHYVDVAPNNVALVAAPDNRPKVLRPEINRPEAAAVSGLVIPVWRAPKIKILPVPKLASSKLKVKPTPIGLRAPRMLTVSPDINAKLFMERRRLPMGGVVNEEAEYAEHKQALAVAAGLPKGDIKLVGVYCSVPLGAASAMEFDEFTGSLLLTLRENSSVAIQRLQRPVVTLILGKVKATGKVVRAFL